MPNKTSIVKAAIRLLSGQPLHFVGGAVRDRLLGRSTTDFDLALPGDPTPLAERLARELAGTSFPLDAERGILRISFANGLHFDFASYRKN